MRAARKLQELDEKRIAREKEQAAAAAAAAPPVVVVVEEAPKTPAKAHPPPQQEEIDLSNLSANSKRHVQVAMSVLDSPQQPQQQPGAFTFGTASPVTAADSPAVKVPELPLYVFYLFILSNTLRFFFVQQRLVDCDCDATPCHHEHARTDHRQTLPSL